MTDRQTADKRQTDGRQTDGRATTYSERERQFTFGKNGFIFPKNTGDILSHIVYALTESVNKFRSFHT